MDTCKSKNNCPVFRISGELDHHNAQNIRKELDFAIKKYRLSELILDLKNLNFMDSSGIGIILGRYKKISCFGGKVYAIHADRQIRRILMISGLTKLVEIME